jgi:hypothetical protein
MEDQTTDPPRYAIHVRGFVGDALLGAFSGLHVRRRDRETPDQAALLGVIGWIESLGLELLEVRRERRAGTQPTEAAGQPERSIGSIAES